MRMVVPFVACSWCAHPLRVVFDHHDEQYVRRCARCGFIVRDNAPVFAGFPTCSN